MIDNLSLDQLRVFVAIAETGSFSAAARHLRRAQSAVSNAVANLESALGLTLFDRGEWKPRMTDHGIALLIDARAVLERTDQLRARAKGLTRGVEAELSLVFDVMFPATQLVALIGRFQETFPEVVLRLCTDVLGGVPKRVLSREYDIGVQGSLPDIDSTLSSYHVTQIALAPVAAPTHPLAICRKISNELLREHTQIVLTDHSGVTSGRSFSVFSTKQVFTTDLGSKHEILRAGLGWGFMPLSVVSEDIASGRLLELELGERPPRTIAMPLHIIHRRSDPPGPAGQWVMNELLGK